MQRDRYDAVDPAENTVGDRGRKPVADVKPQAFLSAILYLMKQLFYRIVKIENRIYGVDVAAPHRPIHTGTADAAGILAATYAWPAFFIVIMELVNALGAKPCLVFLPGRIADDAEWREKIIVRREKEMVDKFIFQRPLDHVVKHRDFRLMTAIARKGAFPL